MLRFDVCGAVASSLECSEHKVGPMRSEQEGTCRDAWLRLIQPLIAQVPMLTGIGGALFTPQRTSPGAVFFMS